MLRAQDASMADEQVHLQGQLFQELKGRFPEVPDDVVSSLMQQNGFIRERCIDALGRESNKYLNNGLSLPLSSLRIGGSPPDGHRSGTPTRLAQTDSREAGGHLSSPSSAAANSSKVPSAEHGTSDMQFTASKTFYVNQPGKGGGGGGGGGGDAQNGPYHGYDTSGQGVPSDMWLRYQPGVHLQQASVHPAQTYSHGAVSRGGAGPLSTYPPQSQSSGPASVPPLSQPTYVPQRGWSYDPNHRTPTHHRGPPQSFTQRFPPAQQGVRTPSPQQPYSMYPFDYPPQYHLRAPSPGSPGSTSSQTSGGGGGGGGGGYPHQGPQSFNPVMVHPSSSTATTSPSGTSNLWYMTTQNPGHQGSGSNCSTPTRSPFPVFSQPWQPDYIPIDSEHYAVHPSHIVGQPKSSLEGRRGSEDTGYTQALLLHQGARMEKLRHDLDNSIKLLEKLKSENMEMERESSERRNQRSSSFPTADDVGKMREENRRLIIDIQLMTREIDMFNNGQALLGVVDPQEQQSFYRNIGSTGQRGSIHAGGEGADRLPIEEEVRGSRVPPARPPPPSVPPVANNTNQNDAPPSTLDPGHDPDEGDHWNCSECTFLNHPALHRCEFCEMPRLTANACPVVTAASTNTQS